MRVCVRVCAVVVVVTLLLVCEYVRSRGVFLFCFPTCRRVLYCCWAVCPDREKQHIQEHTIVIVIIAIVIIIIIIVI